MDINRIITIIRNLKEEAPTVNVGSGNIAGTPEAGDTTPPVHLKKRKRQPTPVGRYGTRRTWLQNGKS